MSLFFRAPAPVVEQRAITTIDWSRGNDFDVQTNDALSVVPVFAACRLISDSIATLPLQSFTKSGDVRRPAPLPVVFATETRIEWVQQAVMSLLLHGNAYGLVVMRDGQGLPSKVVWLDPSKVRVDESGPLPVFRFQGRDLDPSDVKHIPAYSVPGSVVGVSPIGACSLLTSTGTATQKMMRDWFTGRAVPGVTLQNNEKVLDAEQAAAVAERLRARLKNGQPFVHGKDWDINVLKMPAEDAGFVASAKLNATQVATIYGIPPEMIGGETGSSLTYSTVEQNALNFAQFTLRPWLAKLEQEFSGWMHAPRFVKFNVDAMIRVDTKTRYEVHKISREIGLDNVDELRALEDKAPLPDGQGQDYTPLARVQAPTSAPADESLSRSLVLDGDRRLVLNVDARTDVHSGDVTVNPATVDARSTVVVPETPVTVTDSRQSATPVVNVAVEPTPVTVQNKVDVKPADVVLPKRRRKVVHDAQGRVAETIEEDM